MKHNEVENKKTIKSSEPNARRQKRVTRSLQVTAVLGITMTIYGFHLGKKSGYLQGVNAGYVKAGQELIASWREHSEQMKLYNTNDY